MSNDFFTNIISGVDAELKDVQRPTELIDTGSYTINALVSADIFGGYPRDRITMFAGETQTGKTFFCTAALREFLIKHPDGYGIYIDTEQAVDGDVLALRGIDPKRVAVFRPDTVEKITMAIRGLIQAIETEKERKPVFVVLDSLGNASSGKEVRDVLAGSDKADFTRAKEIKKLFRVATVKLGQLNIPFFIANHTYDNVGGYGPAKKISGGSGVLYMSSTICMLTRYEDKDTTGMVNGIVLKVKNLKSRFSRPGNEVNSYISFENGLHRYYGLLDIAEKAGIVKKVSTRYELPDGSKHYAKTIYEDGARFFDKEMLDKINQYVKKNFALSAFTNDEQTPTIDQEFVTDDFAIDELEE